MDTNHLLAGGFVVGLVAALWSKIKAAVARLTSYLVVKVDVEDKAAAAVARYAWAHFRRSPYGPRRYRSFGEFVKPNGRHEDVGYESVGKSPVVYWKGWKPLVVQFEQAPAGQGYLGNTMPMVLRFLRGTFDADTLVADALREHNDARHTTTPDEPRFVVRRITGFRSRKGATMPGGDSRTPQYANPVSESVTAKDERLLTWTKEDLGPVKPIDPLAAVSMTPEMEDLVATAKRWMASKKWYEEKRVPWRMGYLLWGKPGSGKSSLARAIGQTLDVPVFAYDLSTYDNAQFSTTWQDMLGSAPCIALLEDIDAVFHGRENVTDGEDGGGLTFDCLLNLISGVGDSSGVLTIVTTNRVELLDDALGKPDPNKKGFSTRPGRIDRAVEFPALDEEGRRKIARRILSDCPDEIEPTVAAHAGASGAQFEDACARKALDRYWGTISVNESEPCSKCSDSISTRMGSSCAKPAT